MSSHHFHTSLPLFCADMTILVQFHMQFFTQFLMAHGSLCFRWQCIFLQGPSFVSEAPATVSLAIWVLNMNTHYLWCSYNVIAGSCSAPHSAINCLMKRDTSGIHLTLSMSDMAGRTTYQVFTDANKIDRLWHSNNGQKIRNLLKWKVKLRTPLFPQ